MANNQYAYNGIEMKLSRYQIMISGGDGCDPLSKMFFEAEPSDQVSVLCMMLASDGSAPEYSCFRDGECAELTIENSPGDDDPEPDADPDADDVDPDGDDADPDADIDIRRKQRAIRNPEHTVEYVATMALRDDSSRDVLLYTIHHRIDGYLVNNEVMPLEKIYLLFSEHNARFRADTIGKIEADPDAMNKFLLFEMLQRNIKPVDWRSELKKLYLSRDTTGDIGFEFPDGTVVRAHKIALTHTSKMFESMLDGSIPAPKSATGNYLLVGIDAKNFEHVIRYVYTGEIDWTALPSVSDFIQTADYLRVEALVAQISLDPPPQSKPSDQDGILPPDSVPPPESTKLPAEHLSASD